jgi:hypothetical protein
MGKQEFLALSCFSCSTFQSQIKNKSGKWICKICNEKQSVQKIFGISSNSKDIRYFYSKILIFKKNFGTRIKFKKRRFGK